MADKLPPLPKGLTIVDDKLPPLPKGLTVVEEKKNRIQNAPPTGTQTSKSGSLPFQSQIDTKPAPYVKPKVKPKNISEAVEDDNNYLGAIYNNLIGAGSDFIGGFTRLVAKSNPYGSPVLAATADVLGNKAEQVVEKLRSSSSSKQYEEKIQQGFDLTKGVFTKENAKALPLMISRFAGDLGLAIPTAGASYLAQGYNQGLKEFDKAVDNRTTDDPVAVNNARELFAISYSTISSVADRYSLGFLTKSNPVAKKVKEAILKETVQELATKVTGKITADVIEETASRIAKKGLNKFKSVGLKGLTSAGVEGGTEVITGVGTDIAKLATNSFTDKNIFNKEEIVEDFWKNRLNEFGGGTVLGGIAGSAIRGIKSVDDMVAERVSSATNINNIGAVAQEIEKDLTTRYNEGSLDADRYDEIIKNLNNYVKATESIPFDIGAKKRKEAIQSIVERDRVAEAIKVKQEQMSAYDDSLAPQAQQEIDILEAKKQSLNDNIVEATADEKFKYSKDPEKDKWYKQLGEDGELEEISKKQYELETQSVPQEKAQEVPQLAKPTFDTEEQITEEAQQAEAKFAQDNDQVTYEQKMKELDDRANNLVPAPEDAEIGKPEEIDTPRKVIYVQKFSSDKGNENLTERQIGSVEKAINAGIKAGKTGNEIYGILNALGFVPANIAGLQENLREYLNNRVEGKDNRTFQETQTQPQEDAIQVETAGQVPVLTEATVGEEVEQGKPQPEAEVLAEEGVKAEEVVSGVDKNKLSPKKMVGQLTKNLINKGNRKELRTSMGDVGFNYTVGDVEVTLSDDFDFGELDGEEQQADVSINFIGVTKPESMKNGLASKELDRIISLADLTGTSLSLTIDPQGATFGQTESNKKDILSYDSLKEWYKKRGFVFDEDSSYGYRKPLIAKEQSLPTQEVVKLRAEEQAELKAAIPNADQYLTDGKVDEDKLTKPEDKEVFNEIYDDYNELISPLLLGVALEDVNKARSVKYWMEPEFGAETENYPQKGKPNSFIKTEQSGTIMGGGKWASDDIVAYDKDGKIVGSISIAKDGKDKGAFKIVVREDAKRQGWGKKILDEAEKQGIALLEYLA
jgi:hypothetical protein